jgi:hypothetical protein
VSLRDELRALLEATPEERLGAADAAWRRWQERCGGAAHPVWNAPARPGADEIKRRTSGTRQHWPGRATTRVSSPRENARSSPRREPQL